MCRYDVCLFQLIDVISCAFCKKSTFLFSRFVFYIIFCAAFFGLKPWKDFMSIWRNLKTWELFLALINLILAWSLYLSSIYEVGSCSDECGHLYPLLAIFKIGMLIKYSLNYLAISSSREIILSSPTKLVLECFVTFSDRNSLTVFQNVLLLIINFLIV